MTCWFCQSDCGKCAMGNSPEAALAALIKGLVVQYPDKAAYDLLEGMTLRFSRE